MKQLNPIYGTIAIFLLVFAAQAQSRLDLATTVAGNLTEMKHWSEIPAPVRDVLVKEWKSDWIADPGEPFQVTDVIGPDKLPGRRLIFATRARTAWLVCFETGGVAHSFHLAVIPSEGDRVSGKLVLVLLLPPPVTDLASLRKAISEHRYHQP